MNWLSGRSFDRRSELRTDPQAVERLLTGPAARIVAVSHGRVLTATEDDAPVPLYLKALDIKDLGERDWVFLGGHAGHDYFAVEIDEPSDLVSSPEAKFSDLRRTGPLLEADDAAILGYARAMTHWHRRSQFCSMCGRPSRRADGGHRRICTDDACASEQHPRTDSAVIVLVHHEDECLLARSPHFPPGMLSTLAGFVEPGESLEDCVIREVKEEVGVELTDVAYHSSQPWPFPQSLMVGFHARALSKSLQVDPTEIEEARWVHRSMLADESAWGDFTVPPRFAIARRLIEAWLASF